MAFIGSMGGGSGGSQIFNLSGTIGVDSKAAESALDRFLGVVDGLAAAVEKMAAKSTKAFSDTRQSTISLTQAMEALAAAGAVKTMSSFTDKMLDAAKTMQGFTRALTGVTGSVKEAQKALKEVSDYSDRTPIDTDQLKEAAVRFASLKQPILENLDLAAKLSYLFKVDMPRASTTIAEANDGVIDTFRRLRVEFGFTSDQARKYGAIVTGGHLEVGTPGSEANKRLMKALRAFVADREKGLGGDLFAGSASGITGALSNLRSGLFLTFAALGQTLTPTIASFAKVLRDLLDSIRNLPTPILSLVAHFGLLMAGIAPLVAIFTTLWGFMKMWGLVTQFATAIAGLGATIETTTVAATGLQFALGPMMAAFALASVGIALYQASLEKADKATLEAAAHIAELHKQTQSVGNRLMEKSGVSETNASYNDISSAGFTSTELKASRDKMLTFQQAKQERLDDLESQIRAGVAANIPASPEIIAERDLLKQEVGKYRLAAAKFGTAVFVKSMKDLWTQVKDIANPKTVEKAPPREYHEIMKEAKRDQENRDLNLPGVNRGYMESRLKSQIKESERALMVERQNAIDRLQREQGEVTKQEREEIMSGKRDDVEQWKAYLELRKRLTEVQKEGLDLGDKERKQAEKIADLQHKNTPEKRIALIMQEQKAYAEAYKNRVISEEDYDDKIRQLELEREKIIQNQIDNQRNVDIELAKLYGDDVTAAQKALDKKVQGWQEAGVREVDIEKLKNAEILKAQSDMAIRSIEIEQRIADERANIRTKNATTLENSLQERYSQGEDVGGQLRAARGAEAEAQKQDIDNKVKRTRSILKKQLAAENDPAKRRELQAQLENLEAKAKAEKDAIDQNVGSRNRADERAENKAVGESEIGKKKVRIGQLDFENQMLELRQQRGGEDESVLIKKRLENTRKQYELNRQILIDKEKLEEVGRTELEKQNLRNQLQIDLLKLQGDSLKTMEAITAEMEKQNKKDNKDGFTLGGTYSSYADAMKADEADSAAMREKFYKKKDKLATKLGFSEAARERTVFLPEVTAAGNMAAEASVPGASGGLTKTHERWRQIQEAGKAAELKGRAKLVIQVESKDAAGNKVADTQEAIIPLEKSVPQDTRNPLGGVGGRH